MLFSTEKSNGTGDGFPQNVNKIFIEYEALTFRPHPKSFSHGEKDFWGFTFIFDSILILIST